MLKENKSLRILAGYLIDKGQYEKAREILDSTVEGKRIPHTIDNPNNVCRVLNYLKSKYKLTSSKIAEETDTSIDTINKLSEKLVQDPKLEVVARLAYYFGIPLEDFIEADPEDLPPVTITHNSSHVNTSELVVKLRHLLDRDEITQVELSKHIRASLVSLRKVARGVTLRPSLSIMSDIADYFRVPVSYFVTYDLKESEE